MAKANQSDEPMIFANRKGLAAQIVAWVGDKFKHTPIVLICVSNNAGPGNDDFNFPDPKNMADFVRALVIFEGIPIDLDAIGAWRNWVMNKGAWDLRIAFLQELFTEESLKKTLEVNCKSWFMPQPEPETRKFKVGDYVQMPKEITEKDDPALLTMMFGSMGTLLTQVEVVARRFKAAISNKKLLEDKIKKYHAQIDALLAGKPKPAFSKPDDLGVEGQTDHLPRLLLRGASGVGKTLIARYLHASSGLEGRPLHISIPEYLGKEDMFEYTLFGYAAGNYTGGRPEGDHGLLLHNVGGVVFLDEIGEANSVLQAKLLTFLDHYKVRPRGWLGDPFYCPVLVVAATNRDLEKKVNGEPLFRKDLLARFTDRHPIPALRERMGDLPFILDCLLQRTSINPNRWIEEIGQQAFEFLKTSTFEEGNFRELEDLFRSACQRAIRDARHYLVKADFSQE